VIGNREKLLSGKRTAKHANPLREGLTSKLERGMRVERHCERRQRMPTQIKITIGEVTVYAELLDTSCAKAIEKSLPIEARPNVWGDEFYFTIQVNMPLDETATTRIAVGDIGFWPPGNALAIFFGPTPISSGSDPVPASAVNIVGKIIGDAMSLRKAKGASIIRIERSSEK
jgi:hypothetical protein